MGALQQLKIFFFLFHTLIVFGISSSLWAFFPAGGSIAPYYVHVSSAAHQQFHLEHCVSQIVNSVYMLDT